MADKGATPFLDHDFTYMSHTTNEFVNMHIGLSFANDLLELIITADQMPDIVDLNNALKTIRRDNLQKLKLDIWNDFKVILKSEGVSYEVIINAETEDITGIEKIG